MRRKIIITFWLLGIIIVPIVAQNSFIDYFGQTPPGDSAVVFAPGIISIPNRKEWGINLKEEGSGGATLSPDGRFLFISRSGDIYWISTKIIDDI